MTTTHRPYRLRRLAHPNVRGYHAVDDARTYRLLGTVQKVTDSNGEPTGEWIAFDNTGPGAWLGEDPSLTRASEKRRSATRFRTLSAAAQALYDNHNQGNVP